MSAPMLLIDAYSQIFRAYYALAALTNSRGEPVNALYGFTRLLQRLEREYPGRRGALVFDCGRVGFRLNLNPGYKANRKPTPEDLKAQVPAIREMAAAFGWPLLEEPEYEADDLIGALARHEAGPVLIVSSDKDLSQLICDRVAQLVPSSRNGFERRGAEEVRAKFGVGPERVVDYLALLGDAADNIPGAHGIGAKGAAAILNEYGALEPLLENTHAVADKYRAKLEASRDILKRNIALIKLKTELPARLSDPALCTRHAPDYAKIKALCARYDLHALLRDLEKSEAASDSTLFSSPAMPAKIPPKNTVDSSAMEQGTLF